MSSTNAPQKLLSRSASGLRSLGQPAIGFVQNTGAGALFVAETAICMGARWFTPRRTLQYIYEIGFKTTPLILMVGFFTGLVLGLQAYYSLIRFGSESLIGSLVALSIVREVGPVFTAVMIVGQAGSALCAEIGVQRNSEQLDALKMMGVRPLAYVVGPRILAGIVSFPLLTAAFNLIGIFGGAVAAVTILGTDAGTFWSNVRSGLEPSDMFNSHFKGLVFGFLTISVCTFEGFYSHTRSKARGARGVSESATRAVVVSSVLILFSNFLMTSFVL